MNTKNDKIKLFFLLEKTLNRCDLNENKMPENKRQWQEFLYRINNSFFDFEQERYLLERSMEISSREFVTLTERFENAESIAHIGHWYYYPAENKILWSKEMYHLFGMNQAQPTPFIEQLILFFHKDDRTQIQHFFDLAASEGKSFEGEFRIYNQLNNEIIWVYIKAQTTVNKNYYNLFGVMVDISERKNSEKALEKQDQLIMLSRQAGMAEIASAVVHNIGNILNSLNVSVMMIQELVGRSEINHLDQVTQMMRENIPKNSHYLINDEKGKFIPDYLISLSENITAEHKEMQVELKNIAQHIDHIKSIVVMQNNVSGIAGIKEKVEISEICDLAIQMSGEISGRHEIMIYKKYEYQRPVVIDKTKVLQILVNLIKNAKDSLNMCKNNHSKEMHFLITHSSQPNNFEIRIKDNGVGIDEKYLTKIFSMGYTTKTNGHGFGLHASAITAKELGGSLIVKSDGLDKGAVFILTLPSSNLQGDAHG